MFFTADVPHKIHPWKPLQVRFQEPSGLLTRRSNVWFVKRSFGVHKWQQLQGGNSQLGFVAILANVGKTIINHRFGNGLYHLFMVICGVVYYCFSHIISHYSIHGASEPTYNWGATLYRNPRLNVWGLLCHAQAQIHAMETVFTVFTDIQHSKCLQNEWKRYVRHSLETLHRLLGSSISLQWSSY